MSKFRIGISIGDINGIGLEVILKGLQHEKLTEHFTPVVYGSSKVISYHKNIVDFDFQFQSCSSVDQLHEGKVNVVNCWEENVNITLGQPTELSGKYAVKSLEYSVRDLKNGLIDALVTAPIHKHAMNLSGFNFPGHTEYLTQELSSGDSLMFMVSDSLRIGLVTNHLPIREVADAISKELIIQKINLMNDTLKMDFGIERPVMAVLGLNPHAGDEGLLGEEDEKMVRPAVVETKKKGLIVMGPFPADGFFGSGQYKKFDGILAMYHDQGLVPFKTLSFGGGVNFTAGLSAVRTSPDHGTAFDIAGKNEANPASFRKAVYMALDIARNRKDYVEMHQDAVVKKESFAEEDEVLDGSDD